MITFSKLGKHGRLGNQLFQIAATIGIAKRYNQPFAFPSWVYSKYFIKDLPVMDAKPTHIFNEIPSNAQRYTHVNCQQNGTDLFGYFQSHKYFENCIPEIMETFTFNREYKDAIELKYKNIFTNRKKVIALSIRRGDFVGNPNYTQLGIMYYFSALEKYFPNWQENNNVIVFSDDMKYCKLHFEDFENVYFADNLFDNTNKAMYWSENAWAMEQLCLMTMCHHFIISNSTFSWWGAYLGETSKSKVIRPVSPLDGKLKSNNIFDHYPNNWISHEEEKYDLRDVTFMIPVHYDHMDRKQNLALNVCMLQRSFNTNIVIMEQGTSKFDYFQKYNCQYIKCEDKVFHRTKMLNEMALAANTSIIVNWDADVFFSPLQIIKSVQLIRDSSADVVYPYDGRFARVPRGLFNQLERFLDVGIYHSQKFKGTFPNDKMSVGGAIFFNRSKYFEGGGENENFVAYGPEDVERFTRFTRLNYNVKRLKGILYHIDHYKGANSKCDGNPYDKQNHDELEKIYTLTFEELRQYVNTWPQTKNYLKTR